MDRREIRSDVRLETHMDEFVSRCGYCGDVIDYCQGHGEDERAEFGFDYDSDEYEARREFFERNDTREIDFKEGFVN